MLGWELRSALRRSYIILFTARVLSVLQKVEQLNVFDAGLFEALPLKAIIKFVICCGSRHEEWILILVTGVKNIWRSERLLSWGRLARFFWAYIASFGADSSMLLVPEAFLARIQLLSRAPEWYFFAKGDTSEVCGLTLSCGWLVKMKWNWNFIIVAVIFFSGIEPFPAIMQRLVHLIMALRYVARAFLWFGSSSASLGFRSLFKRNLALKRRFRGYSGLLLFSLHCDVIDVAPRLLWLSALVRRPFFALASLIFVELSWSELMGHQGWLLLKV